MDKKLPPFGNLEMSECLCRMSVINFIVDNRHSANYLTEMFTINLFLDLVLSCYRKLDVTTCLALTQRRTFVENVTEMAHPAR